MGSLRHYRKNAFSCHGMSVSHMARHPRKMRDVTHFKTKRFPEHMTVMEVARAVNRDRSWILKLEKDGRIPKARRVQAGDISVRLWSPEQVEEIKSVLEKMKP